MSKNSIGVFVLLISSFFYATYGISAKIIGSSFDIFYQTWTRVAISLALFFVFGLIFKLFKKIQKEDFKWFVIIGLSGSLVVAPLLYAFVHLPLGTTLFIQYAGTVITSYILGSILYKERLNKVSFVSLFLSVAGLWLVYRGDIDFNQLLPMIAAFISGVFFSVYFVVSKKVNDRYSPTQINAVGHAFILVINFFIFLLLQEGSNLNFFSVEWAANIWYGVAGFIGAGLTIFGFKYIESHKGSLVLLTEILFGFLFGLIFFNEVLSLVTILGGSLIILAIALPDMITLLSNKKTTNANPL